MSSFTVAISAEFLPLLLVYLGNSKHGSGIS